MNTTHNRFGAKKRIARVLAGSAISAAVAVTGLGLASPANADICRVKNGWKTCTVIKDGSLLITSHTRVQ
jgi:hypothetical protein